MDWKAVEGSLGKLQKAELDAALSRVPDNVMTLLSEHGIVAPAPKESAPLTAEEVALQKLQLKDTAEALQSCATLVRQISTKEELIQDLLHGKIGEGLQEKARAIIVGALREQITNLRDGFEEIAKQNPEAFLAVHSREIRAWPNRPHDTKAASVRAQVS